MSRGKSSLKPRLIAPDAKYNSATVAKLINYCLLNGKKTIATKLVYKAFEQIAKSTERDALEIFELAIKNAAPILEVKGKRIGGANYQIPFEVPRARRETLALKWMITSARAKQGKSFDQFLAQEIVDAFHNEGAAIKKKEEMHRMAEANKAFAHFAKFS